MTGFRGRVLDAGSPQELSKNAISHPTHPSHLESNSEGDSRRRHVKVWEAAGWTLTRSREELPAQIVTNPQ